MWSFVPTTRAKDSIRGFRLSIRESLITNPAPADTLDMRRAKLELGEEWWRQVAPAAPLPSSLAGLLPAQPVLLSSEWQLTINSTVHRINVQYHEHAAMQFWHPLRAGPVPSERRLRLGLAQDTRAHHGGANQLFGLVGEMHLTC